MTSVTASHALNAIPAEFRSQVWCKANVQYPPTLQLPAAAIVEILTKVAQAIHQIPFSWSLIDQPPDGSIFLLWHPATMPCPPDGMHFLSPEKVYQLQANGKTLEVHETRHGFFPLTESQTLHTRRRYRLLGTGLDHMWLNHYVRGKDSDVVKATLAASRPPQLRRYPLPVIASPPFLLVDPKQVALAQAQAHAQAQAQAQAQVQAQVQAHAAQAAHQVGMDRNAAAMSSLAQQHPHPHHPSHQPTPTPPQQQQQQAAAAAVAAMNMRRASATPAASAAAATAAAMEEAEVEQGDLMDVLTPRQISLSRYVRHHEWMEQVLVTLQAASDIEPPSLWAELKTPEELEQMCSRMDEQLSEYRERQKEKFAELEHADELTAYLKAVGEVRDEQALRELQTKVEEFVNKKVVLEERCIARPVATLSEIEMAADTTQPTTNEEKQQQQPDDLPTAAPPADDVPMQEAGDAHVTADVAATPATNVPLPDASAVPTAAAASASASAPSAASTPTPSHSLGSL
ncbi:SWI/SNF and RSC complex subunit Ssr4 [Schizosaccharomyces japonicus yFS275]|uniref:SWI/SNF and RSC complex subunit Ssr4 n=1 Tax=Schizosaccharomyces japonicus (strain yFS275 / FY16936) TaxID=402676 RepID=B6K4L4_SCHJY|nr:SWI/SNF and RSC complex subunit Ssr4 [Schizosaccharomyces japonicus yFS275]EEB08421.2 SWI/SNF and RSC complex subunit Ssr4 [Schizosaccharomyces japonicus yFS275]